jgi:hypothetical protein
MDAIKARIEKAATKKLEEAKNKLKEELLKALGLPKVLYIININKVNKLLTYIQSSTGYQYLQFVFVLILYTLLLIGKLTLPGTILILYLVFSWKSEVCQQKLQVDLVILNKFCKPID